MSTPINFYRDKRHYRTAFREGRFLLNTEAMEIELEGLTALREQIKRAFGEYAALGDSLKVEIDPSNINRIIIRPGEVFIDGYPIKFQAGTDHLIGLGLSPSEIDSSDFVRVENNGSDVGGVSIDFFGASAVLSGQYSIVFSIQEELITAASDPNLRSANLNEDTADKHRIIYNLNIVSSASLDSSPIPYVGSDAGNLVNEIEITKSGLNYGIVSSSPVTGAEAVDGRNLELVINNGNGSTTAAFPVSNVDLSEYIHGKLIDSNGIEFHITNMYVTPGQPNTVTLTLDLEKTRPVTLLTNQSEPVIADSISYKLIKRDLYVTSGANLPQGKRFFLLADLNWNGTAFLTIEDKRPQVLAYDGVLASIQNKGLNLMSEGLFHWDKDQNLIWEENIIINSVFDAFEWTIPAGDVVSLFSTNMAVDEILYVTLSEVPVGGTITLKRGVRGLGDLTEEYIRAHKVVWIAKRLSDDRIYFNGGMILNNLQNKPFYDEIPERLLPQDILSLGYNAMFDDDLYNSSNVNPANSTGLFFANAYQMQYSNRVITLVTDNIVISAPSYTIAVGDVVTQGLAITYITNINSQTDFDVADGSVLTDSLNATISQKAETFNLRTLGAANEQIASYFSDDVDNLLVTYDDSVIPQTGTPVRVGFVATSDNVTYTDPSTRKESINEIEDKTPLSSLGTDVRLRFFSSIDSGDGTSTLDSFRIFMHDRLFVGTLLGAIANAPSSPGVSSGTFIQAPSQTNNSGGTLVSARAVSIDPTGLVYADASIEAIAASTLGVLTANVLDSASTDAIIVNGQASGVLTGLGFLPGDEVYLGLTGNLVDAATVAGFPPGHVQKQIGFALNTTDLMVQIAQLELL